MNREGQYYIDPLTGDQRKSLQERVNDALDRCNTEHVTPLTELRDLLARNPDVARILDLRAHLHL